MEARTPVEENTSVVAARRFIKENFSRMITLDDIASSAHMSKFYFSRMFKEQTGISPKKYLAQCRMEAARQLLVNSKLTLKAIAEEVGFTDEYNLSRNVHRSFGIPPATLRANTLKQSVEKPAAQKKPLQTGLPTHLNVHPKR
jgi:AraC-like DNA-binding protein